MGAGNTEAAESTLAGVDDVQLCKEKCKELCVNLEKRESKVGSLLERKSLAANTLLKGTLERAYLRIGKDRPISAGPVTAIADKQSLFTYASKLSVGDDHFTIKFRNNPKSHKIERLWVGPVGAAVPEHGEDDSSLTLLFKAGYEEDKNDVEFELYARRPEISTSRKHSRLHFGDEHLLTINSGKPLPEIPREKFDVLAIRRYHRDKGWVLIFLLYWIIEIGVAIHAFANGRPSRVIHGVDSYGNICGTNNELVDLSNKPNLWYPDPGATRALCVTACPSLNGTFVDDYLARLSGNTSVAVPLLPVTIATVDLGHRCLPLDGTATANIVSASASLFADVQNGWTSTLVTCVAAFVLGMVWIQAMLTKPRALVGISSCLAHLGLALFAVSFLLSYFTINLPEGLKDLPLSTTRQLVDNKAQTFIVCVGLVSCALLFYLLYKDCKVKNDTGNAMKVFDLTTEALKACNISMVTANCLPKKRPSCISHTVPQTGTEDVRVEVDNTKDSHLQSTAVAQKWNARPVMTFPIYNFLILLAFLIVWLLVFFHLISLGTIEQTCECVKSLASCSCNRYFRFDDGARWFALVHLYGLLWGACLVVNVSRVTMSMAVSTWYFSEAKDLEVRTVPADLVRSSYRKTILHHSGSLLKASFYHPILFIARPLAFALLQVRGVFSCVGRVTFCCRGCIRSVLLSCCCFQTIAYLDIRAAMQQIALRGSSFLRGASVGTKLKMRNEARVRGLGDAIAFKLMFGKVSLFGMSFFLGFVHLRYVSAAGVGSVGAPVIVLCLNAIVAYATMSLFVSQYSISIETILQDFYEDCERNIRSTEVFMPLEFRKFIDDYGYYASGTFPSDPTAMYTKLFNAKTLGVLHVATKETLCHYVTTMDGVLSDRREWPEENEGWYLKADRPLDHESQPRNTLDVYHKKYGRTFVDNFLTLLRIPATAKSLAGDKPWRSGLKHIEWDQIRLPVHGGGYHKLKPLDPKVVAEKAPHDPHLHSIKDGQVKAYHGFMEKGVHAQSSEQQCLQYGQASIDLMVNLKTLRVARRLVDAEEDPNITCATPASLSEEEKRTYLEDNGFGNASFRAWCAENDLVLEKVEKYKTSRHPKLSFAKDAFVFLHQTFYFYDSARSWVPVEPVDVIKGDVGSSGTINNLYVAILRLNGIVARCLSGAWLWSNDGSYTAQGIQRGATEGEMLAMDFQKRTMSEFYLDQIGWIPTDATPTRLSANVDPTARRERGKLGKYGWRKDLTMTCMANFGNDSGMLLLNTSGFEMGKPMVQLGPAGRSMGRVLLNQREFQCTDLQVSAYKPTAGFKDELLGAKEALSPVDPNAEKSQCK